MYGSIEILGFRCFERFDLNALGRINLLVGTNNSGKTALLEAVELLASRGAWERMHAASLRRGEAVAAEERGELTVQADARRFFYGHRLQPDVRLEIRGFTPTGVTESLQVSLRETTGDEQEIRAGLDIAEVPLRLTRRYTRSSFEDTEQVWVGSHGGMQLRGIRRPSSDAARVHMVPTGSIPGEALVEMIASRQLTEDEERLLEALRIIDDRVEALRIVPTHVARAARSGVIVKLRGESSPVPLGSMGDGTWRILALAAAMVSVPEGDGVVLIDDIDTGLHYSVMERMWTMVSTLARRLELQVFATTHSRDCYESLAAVTHGASTSDHDVTIHRLERGSAETIAFSEEEIVAAAERGIEVR